MRKIGFLHLGDDTSDPVQALAACLEKESKEATLGEALIVIPEAFNLRGGYSGKDNFIDGSFDGSLQQLSVELGVAFVAGLIDEPGAGKRGYSSAYLLDRTERILLSHKAEPDGSENYQPCPDEFNTPVRHRGIGIGALICMDAAEDSTPIKRHATVVARLKALDAPEAVLCIPARMPTYDSKLVAQSQSWPDWLNVVVANAGTSQRPSVIRQRSCGDATPQCFSGPGSKVEIRPLCDDAPPR